MTMFRLLCELMALPFALAFGLIRLGFEVMKAVFRNLFGVIAFVVVLSLLGSLFSLLFGLAKGLLGVAAAVLAAAFIVGMFNRGLGSSSGKTRRSASDVVEDIRASFRQSAR